MTNQPKWKCVANLGDTQPWDYGGAFVMVDQTGVYTPELWIWEKPTADNRYTEYRILLEQCTFEKGILSDNKYHPECEVWFGEWERLSSMARSAGVNVVQLVNFFRSENPIERAHAYLLAANHYGEDEFDQYPIIHEAKGVKTKMKTWLKQAEAERNK
jgi:hypothetical protein